jgi:hypothetical protein
VGVDLLQLLAQSLDLQFVIGLDLYQLAHLGLVLLFPEVSLRLPLDGMLSGLIELALKVLVMDDHVPNPTLEVVRLEAHHTLNLQLPPKSVQLMLQVRTLELVEVQLIVRCRQTVIH